MWSLHCADKTDTYQDMLEATNAGSAAGGHVSEEI